MSVSSIFPPTRLSGLLSSFYTQESACKDSWSNFSPAFPKCRVSHTMGRMQTQHCMLDPWRNMQIYLVLIPEKGSHHPLTDLYGYNMQMLTSTNPWWRHFKAWSEGRWSEWRSAPQPGFSYSLPETWCQSFGFKAKRVKLSRVCCCEVAWIITSRTKVYGDEKWKPELFIKLQQRTVKKCQLSRCEN